MNLIVERSERDMRHSFAQRVRTVLRILHARLDSNELTYFSYSHQGFNETKGLFPENFILRPYPTIARKDPLATLFKKASELFTYCGIHINLDVGVGLTLYQLHSGPIPIQGPPRRVSSGELRKKIGPVRP